MFFINVATLIIRTQKEYNEYIEEYTEVLFYYWIRQNNDERHRVCNCIGSIHISD